MAISFRPISFHDSSTAVDGPGAGLGGSFFAASCPRTPPATSPATTNTPASIFHFVIALSSVTPGMGHLAGNATIRPSDEKPVLTEPPPPALVVSRARRSSKLQLLISPALAPQRLRQLYRVAHSS